jgi:methionine sulfoxide reductase catalytic subunit
VSRLRDLGTPVFWVEGHPGVLSRDSWQIEVAGLCDRPKTFFWEELASMPKSVADARLTSVTRFSVRGKWGGVRLSDLFDAVGAHQEASYVRFWSYRSIYDTSVSIEIARQEKVLLAYEFDGEALEEDYGGPIRVFCPYLWGYKSAKSVIKVELSNSYVSGFWEVRGYPDDAIITSGKVRDMNSGGRTRPIPDGEVIGFLDE